MRVYTCGYEDYLLCVMEGKQLGLCLPLKYILTIRPPLRVVSKLIEYTKLFNEIVRCKSFRAYMYMHFEIDLENAMMFFVGFFCGR